MEENWTIKLSRYSRVCQQLGLSRQQKVSFIHIIFTGDAEQFFFDELSGIEDWNVIVDVLNRIYNNPAKSRAIMDELRSIKLNDFHDNGRNTDGEALQLLARRIEKLAPKCPPGANDNKSKREYLYYAVRTVEWAQCTINDLVRSGYSKKYKDFLDELTTSEQ